MILQILYLIFSTNCDSLNSEIYNFSRKLKEVEFCKCISKKSFVSSVKIPKLSSEDKENCPMLLNDVEGLIEKYKQIKKELK